MDHLMNLLKVNMKNIRFNNKYLKLLLTKSKNTIKNFKEIIG